MSDEPTDESILGVLMGGFIILFLVIWGTVYLLMEAGVGMTYIPEQTQGIIIEKAIFESPGSRFSGRGPDHYWLRIQRIEEEGWTEFWIVLGDTEYAVQMWNSVALGDFCIQGAGHKGSRTRWTCEEATT